MNCSQNQVQHILLRMGFGDDIRTTRSYVGQTPEEIISSQFTHSKKHRSLNVRISSTSLKEWKMMDENAKREILKIKRAEIKSLNSEWIKEMAAAPSGLNEKMAFFWHDHFPCKSNNSTFINGYLDALRKNALGNFGDLLRAVSKSAAMLQYLNNQQNKKKAPNENFAREVMELFTLGRDNGYTEKDISEAARAFTGWSFTKNGEFIERKIVHDDGIKTIFNKTGHFTGDDVIDLLLENRQTAKYLSEKWVRFFVNSKGIPSLESKVADAFYASKYDIKSALMVMFTSKEFFDKKNIGTRIKSPIELIVGVQRQLNLTIEDESSLLFFQKMLGQTLFDPPNVSGWPNGEDWIDSSSLMFRLRMPQLLFKAAVIQDSIQSFDDNDPLRLRGKLKRIETKFDFSELEKQLNNENIGSYLLQNAEGLSFPTISLLDQVVTITSKPEYQLC